MLIDPKTIRTMAILANAVIAKALLIIGGFFAGQWLDQRFGTSPLFMMLLVMAGLGLGIYWLTVVMKRLQR